MEGTTSVKLFGREPAAVGAFLQALLALLLGLHIVPGLTSETSALISVAGAAVFGGYTAYATKQNLIPAVTAAFQALVAVAVGFGLGDVLARHGYDATMLTGLLTSLLVGGLGLWLRERVDPKAGSPAEPAPVPVEVVQYPPDSEDVVDDSSSTVYSG